MEDGRHVILCIDDDPDILASLRVVLESEGYVVITAASAAEGLELHRARCPDLLIVDVMMEEVDSGLALARSVRQSGSAAPMFFLSSSGDYLFGAVDVGQFGAVGVFQKPVEPAMLLSVVRKALGAPALSA